MQITRAQKWRRGPFTDIVYVHLQWVEPSTVRSKNWKPFDPLSVSHNITLPSRSMHVNSLNMLHASYGATNRTPRIHFTCMGFTITYGTAKHWCHTYGLLNAASLLISTSVCSVRTHVRGPRLLPSSSRTSMPQFIFADSPGWSWKKTSPEETAASVTISERTASFLLEGHSARFMEKDTSQGGWKAGGKGGKRSKQQNPRHERQGPAHGNEPRQEKHRLGVGGGEGGSGKTHQK